jgi:hypothetical protein
MLDEASDRLFTASAMIETLPETLPAMNFPVNRRKLQIIPTQPDNFPYNILPHAVLGAFASLMKVLISQFVI